MLTTPLDHQDLAWMTDLYKAMYNSKIILILVSHEGIVAQFAHLSSGTDACLAEHFFANMLNCVRTMFQPGGMQVPNTIRTVLIGPHPDPFAPLLPDKEYTKLKKHIPDEPHKITTDKCIEVLHFCTAPCSTAESNPQRAALNIGNVKFRSTKNIFTIITGANNIRPDVGDAAARKT